MSLPNSRIADATEAHLRRTQEEKEQATVALKQAQEEVIEQRRVAQQEKDDLQTKFEEEKAQIQQEKEQLLAGAGWSKRSSQQSTSLCDRLREKGGRPSGASSSTSLLKPSNSFNRE
jgi:hypothetical protein